MPTLPKREESNEPHRVNKILVANRGEIAVRVMRTCREMDIPTVAVFSDSDRDALHVRYATEAYHIGPPLPSESYLNIDKLIDVAKRSGADAVHPGYGFLSENPEFTRRCAEEGLTFIGPRPESMEAMASKTAARQVMSKAGVPVVPGLEDSVESIDEARGHAERIGFPVMLKAAMGGGGKGMRKVDRVEDFDSAWTAAKSEALKSFADDRVYIEKFLEKPRHIEVQVFADNHGNVQHLFERECSVQRRHQKVIEEAPSPFVSPEMREKMGEVACQAARAVNYVGAGTVEFLVDAHKNFYFMEMNTRLQVEHPVTEMITGLDLVRMQIEIARGEKLRVPLNLTAPRGWAMEARICAEDADNNFMPAPGKIFHVRHPAGPFVRTDTGVYSGSEITLNYDPMMAKVIAWGATRAEALQRLDRALSEFTVKGVTTNTMFLRKILNHEPYKDGTYDTSIIDKFMEEPESWVTKKHETVAVLASAIHAFKKEKKARTRVKVGDMNPNVSANNWRRSLRPQRNTQW
ncbi:MAG: pyruvate carboxylase subunit A [Myxococcales bacterium]|nr:pyruvate carboxylase subunit A [Myxococcales bacterium]|tara:strand:+ start:407 stop:1966 length:1560 start_codon:yes stop_codon:yes gene_type:complete